MSDKPKTGKVSKALELIRSLETDRIVVGYSGGKDSLAVLDLCSRVFPAERLYAYTLEMLPGCDAERPQMELCAKRYGVSPMRFPHPDLVKALRGSMLRSPKVSNFTRLPRHYKWQDVEQIIRKRIDSVSPCWIALGHRRCDSLQRAGMINKFGHVDGERHKIYPIHDWSPTEVVQYLKSRKLPIPDMYGNSLANTSGISFSDPDTLLYFRKHYPRDYRRILLLFPDAEAVVEREMVRAEHGITHKGKHDK